MHSQFNEKLVFFLLVFLVFLVLKVLFLRGSVKKLPL